MYSVSSFKILQMIRRSAICCYSSLQATNRSTLHISKPVHQPVACALFPNFATLPTVVAMGCLLTIFNLSVVRKQFATSAALMDKWDDPTSAYFENRPVKKEDVDRFIYKFNGKTFLQLSNIFFYGTACVGIYLAPDILLGTLEHDAFNFESFSNIAGIAISTVVIPLFSRMFTKRIVLKMYHNAAKDTYTAHVFSPFLLVKKFNFHHDDIEVPRKNLIINLTTVRAKKYPMFLQAYSFALPSDFNHLMGYGQ